jgi:hypothetical protein
MSLDSLFDQFIRERGVKPVSGRQPQSSAAEAVHRDGTISPGRTPK